MTEKMGAPFIRLISHLTTNLSLIGHYDAHFIISHSSLLGQIAKLMSPVLLHRLCQTEEPSLYLNDA